MLQYEFAKKLFDEINEKAKNDTREGFKEFYEDFFEVGSKLR